jgi:hypothetical protein
LVVYLTLFLIEKVKNPIDFPKLKRGKKYLVVVVGGGEEHISNLNSVRRVANLQEFTPQFFLKLGQKWAGWLFYFYSQG